MFRVVFPPIIRSASTASGICHTITATCRYRGHMFHLTLFHYIILFDVINVVPVVTYFTVFYCNLLFC
jgi:hypothetical protein